MKLLESGCLKTVVEIFIFCLPTFAAIGTTPGSIYRDYVITMNRSANAWRVTSPWANHHEAEQFLPNPVLQRPIADLQNAVSAEGIVDYWGGHPGTIGRKFRFNGNAWLDIPYPSSIPSNKPENYVFQSNPTIAIPLSHLKQGMNLLEGTCSHAIDSGWGQFGWYEMRVRVAYSTAKEHPTGRITFPAPGAVLPENPVIRVDASSSVGVARVEVLAYYDGYNLNGDALGEAWHCSYVLGLKGLPRNPAGIVGWDTQAPYEISWNTLKIPDQKPGAIKLLARIQDKKGIWFVAPIVSNLTLGRSGRSVKLFKPNPRVVPSLFWVRANGEKGCQISVPALEGAVSATMMVRTWNGLNHGENGTPVKVGAWSGKVVGANHDYAFTKVPLSVDHLKDGPNYIKFSSAAGDHEHGCEILWPGPALLVEYDGPQIKIASDYGRSGFKPVPSLTASPNVVRLGTRVVFRLAGRFPGNPAVRIFDASGRIVVSLESPAPIHRGLACAWDGLDRSGSAVPSGWYFYGLEGRGAAKQGRVLMIR